MGAFVNISMGMIARSVFGGSLIPAVVAAIYGAGVTHEKAASQTRVDAADQRADKADSKHLVVVANQNAATATELASENERQALAYAADAEQARSDADRIELARQAAAIAARTCRPVAAVEPQPLVGDAVHAALLGRPVLETDDLAPSLKAAMSAIRQAEKKGKRGGK